jgi:hypothetical protein
LASAESIPEADEQVFSIVGAFRSVQKKRNKTNFRNVEERKEVRKRENQGYVSLQDWL